MARNEVRVSSRRTLILLLAVGLGLVAAFFLYTYVNNIEDEAASDFDLENVLKAVEQIPRGTLGEDAIDAVLVESGTIPREYKPEQAIVNVDSIRGKVAIFDIPAGVAITDTMFVSEEDVEISFRRRLEQPEWSTATISVDQVGSVAGLLVPGDEVNIMVAVEIEEEDLETLPEQPPPGQLVYRFDQQFAMLYQKVHILAVGTATESLPGEDVVAEGEEAEEQSTGDTGLITFNVPPRAAQLIASAQLNSSIYLSLVPTDYNPVEIGPVEAIEPFLENLPGQDADQLTPYGPDGSGGGDE
jgi:Flp pilus assembly protein CpaB